MHFTCGKPNNSYLFTIIMKGFYCFIWPFNNGIFIYIYIVYLQLGLDKWRVIGGRRLLLENSNHLGKVKKNSRTGWGMCERRPGRGGPLVMVHRFMVLEPWTTETSSTVHRICFTVLRGVSLAEPGFRPAPCRMPPLMLPTIRLLLLHRHRPTLWQLCLNSRVLICQFHESKLKKIFRFLL